MTEDFLHYIWRYGLYHQNSLKTEKGLPVSIVKPGEYNRDSGPDFLNAKIQIGSSLWHGHVEIHIKASDWYHHKHQNDKAYDQVILHVVYNHDKQVFTTQGSVIPSVCLDVPDKYFQNYQNMVNTIAPLPCGESWKSLPVLHVENAISAMGVDRMERRFSWLKKKLEFNKGGWQDLYQQVFFRAYGFGKNQENFDILAQSIPSKIIQKHKHNLFQLEALLFGQAGLIPERDSDPYPSALKAEYGFLKNKHNLTIDRTIIWKQMRTRPANQPVPRLAQLAAWIHQSEDVFERVLSSGLETELLSMESFVSSYWKKHSGFGLVSKEPIPYLGEHAIQLLHINAVLPLNAYYQNQHENNDALSKWLEALEQFPAENNYVMKIWKDAGFRIPDAFYSQAFLSMYKNYCTDRKCLKCRLGQLILQN